jgi:hypothetical protein
VKPFAFIAVLIFAIVAVAHVVRLIFGLEIIVQGITIPVWLSAIGAIAAAGMSFMLWRESRSK